MRLVLRGLYKRNKCPETLVTVDSSRVCECTLLISVHSSLYVLTVLCVWSDTESPPSISKNRFNPASFLCPHATAALYHLLWMSFHHPARPSKWDALRQNCLFKLINWLRSGSLQPWTSVPRFHHNVVTINRGIELSIVSSCSNRTKPEPVSVAPSAMRHQPLRALTTKYSSDRAGSVVACLVVM